MRRNKTPQGVTLIAQHTEVVGDVHFKEQLYVNGQVTGNVVSEEPKAQVVVSEGGCVTGEIRVPHVVINGRVEGDVYGSEKVELASNAVVNGNVHYNLIEMQLGALVQGQMLHADNAQGDANVHPLPERKAE